MIVTHSTKFREKFRLNIEIASLWFYLLDLERLRLVYVYTQVNSSIHIYIYVYMKYRPKAHPGIHRLSP